MRLKSFAPAIAVLLASSSFLATRLAAQNPPDPSIAEAARLNRERKKTTTAKPGAVITDDTLHPSTSAASSAASSATTPTSAANTSAPAAAGAPDQPEVSKEDADKRKAQIAAVKQEMKDKQSEVELAQRLLSLDQDALLSKTDYSHDTAGKAKIDSERADLKQKQDDLEKLKAKLQSLGPEPASAPAPPKP